MYGDLKFFSKCHQRFNQLEYYSSAKDIWLFVLKAIYCLSCLRGIAQSLPVTQLAKVLTLMRPNINSAPILLGTPLR